MIAVKVVGVVLRARVGKGADGDLGVIIRGPCLEFGEEGGFKRRGCNILH